MRNQYEYILSKILLSHPLNPHSQGLLGRKYLQLKVNCFLTPLTKTGYPKMCHKQMQKNIFENTFFWPVPLSLCFYMCHCISKGKFLKKHGNSPFNSKRIFQFISFFQLLQYPQFCFHKLRLHWPKSSLIHQVTIRLCSL